MAEPGQTWVWGSKQSLVLLLHDFIQIWDVSYYAWKPFLRIKVHSTKFIISFIQM